MGRIVMQVDLALDGEMVAKETGENAGRGEAAWGSQSPQVGALCFYYDFAIVLFVDPSLGQSLQGYSGWSSIAT